MSKTSSKMTSTNGSIYKRSETFFRGHDLTKLFLQTWSHPNAVGTILFTHGQAEHSDCYQRLIEGLENLSNTTTGQHIWNFVGWDLRGHGRSDGLRGYAEDFDDYVLDYDCFFKEALQIDFVKNKNIVLLGHSMGGLIQTCALIEKKYDQHYPQTKAQILSSPLFNVSVPVPQWKDTGAGLLAKWIPKLTLGNEIKNEMLTRDLDVIREYEKDTYRHNKISSGVYMGFKREFEKIPTRAHEITLPTMLLISDADPIVSTAAAIKFFDLISSKDKTLKIIENGRHELFNDICRSEAYKSVQQFLENEIN